jgi:hypothetical protein
MADQKQAPPDWERIEADYRAGLLSLREIAAANNSNAATILKRAKKGGWERDLAPRIAAKAEALVNKATVNASVNAARTVSDQQIIDSAAQSVASIRLKHRTDIARGQALCMALLGELEAQTGNFPGLAELGEILRQPNDNGADRLNDIYRAVISLPERTKTMKALAESLKGLIGLEREAYGLAAASEDGEAEDRAEQMRRRREARLAQG